MKRLILTILIITSVFLVACTTQVNEQVEQSGALIVPSSSSSGNGALYTVVLEDGRFNPADLVINVGDSVQWINHDQPSIAQDVQTGEFDEIEESEYEDNRRGFDHTISFEDGRLDESLPFGGLVDYRFTESGEYRYTSLLNYHSGGATMQGVVFVR